MRCVHLLPNPQGHLLHKVFPFVSLVSKNHKPVIVLGPKYSSNTLAGLAHCVKAEEVLFTNFIVLVQELHASSQISRQRILEWDSEHHHTTTVVACKVNTFRDFAPRNRKEDRPPAVVTSFFVVVEGHHRLHVVFGFDEYQFVFQNLLQKTHLVPLYYNVLHVFVASKKAHHSVRYNPSQLHHHVSEVPHDSCILAFVELGANLQLVCSFG